MTAVPATEGRGERYKSRSEAERGDWEVEECEHDNGVGHLYTEGD